jgi:triacylglycerol lipase
MSLDFDLRATTVSLKNACILGQAAAVSYEDASTCEAWARRQGFDEDFDFFSSTGVTPHSDTQGFVAQNADMILVAFRGTQPNQRVDWLSDFQASQETWGHPIGKVHKGFYEALRAVWGIPVGGKEMLPRRLVNRGDRVVWITGHSLGGAVAELCAAQASFVHHVPVQGVYTFGQPRVGDEAYARLVQDGLGVRIFRFINNCDIVPRVPFYGMHYRHYGCEIFFNDHEKQVTGTSCVENLAAALQLARLAVNFDAVKKAAEMLVEATIRSGFHGDPQTILHEMVKNQEDAALGAAKLLLASGTQNISDHDMRKDYLARLGTKLVLTQAAGGAT